MKSEINIEDLKTAFEYKSKRDLKYTYFVFKLLQYPTMVRVLTSCANAIIKYNLPLKFFIKQTVFKIFCSGEDIDEAFKTIEKLQKYNVKSVLDYVSEGEDTEKAFFVNTNIIISNIRKLGMNSPGNYLSVKLTGLESPSFFRRVNRNSLSYNSEDKERYDKFISRVDLICKAAHQFQVVVYIDAEDRDMQDLFDDTTELMMEKYNKERAIVFNTLQMYLKDRLTYLERLIKLGAEKNYIPGIKLVRGAYMEKEREAAFNLYMKSPVYDTKEETDASYNKSVEICLRQHNNVETCIATHNDESTLLAVKYIEEFNITDHYEKIKFSQLYGMSDHLTFNLAACGYNTSKYLPYGEVKKAIPYLIRRSEENSSINGQLSNEVIRLKTELQRRKS